MCVQDVHYEGQMLITTQVVSSRPGTPMPLAVKAENGVIPVIPVTNASTVRVSINGLEK